MSTVQDNLRRMHAIVTARSIERAGRTFTLGAPQVDAVVGDALRLGALHEVFAAGPLDAAAAAGFAACLVARADGGAAPVLWISDAHQARRSGALYGHGLAGFGFDPGRVIRLDVSDAGDVLRGAWEGLRAPGLGAVVLELSGMPKAFDLTAARRLMLAAEEGGAVGLILRMRADPEPSPALTRWRVAAAPSRSPGLALPGPTAFDVTLIKHRFGHMGQNWHLEWDHETRSFTLPSLSRFVAALPAGRTDRTGGARKTG